MQVPKLILEHRQLAVSPQHSSIAWFVLNFGQIAKMNRQYILKTIKEHFPNKTIWCYSGFTFEELVGECEDILKYIDVLVDGAFVAEKKNLKLKFRGSENQRIINVKKSLEDKTVTELTEGEYDEY